MDSPSQRSPAFQSQTKHWFAGSALQQTPTVITPLCPVNLITHFTTIQCHGSSPWTAIKEQLFEPSNSTLCARARDNMMLKLGVGGMELSGFLILPYVVISSSVGFLWYPTQPNIFGRFLRILLSCFPLSFCPPQLTSIKIAILWCTPVPHADWSGFKSREFDFVLRLILADFASKIE